MTELNDDFFRHISSEFNDELDVLRRSILEMGGLVEAQLVSALSFFKTNNSSVLDGIEENERKINAAEIDLDDQVESLIVRRQPIASDLRLVLGVSKIVRDLEPPGALTDNVSYDFQFNRVEKQFESYNGIVIRLRYYINVVINRNYNRITKEEEFIVSNIQTEPDNNRPIKMEVGIEECLHIEFEFNCSKFHLKDCILGKVFFNLVRIKIKHMELSIIRKEIVGSG